MKQILFLILLCCSELAALAQSSPTVGNKYLLVNGKPTFINGANYSPSTGWFQILDNWNPASIEKDMDSLHSIGVSFIRTMPLWYLTQPEINRFAQQKFDRFNELVNIAGERGIMVQPALVTGWLDGGIFTPPWVDKNLFTDQKQIDATFAMVKKFAKMLSKNPYIHSYDFGNEINALKGAGGFQATPEQINSWMKTIYRAFKEGDPDRLVTNGIGTGYDKWFPVENISPSCDYMSAHSYPYFHSTLLDDPWFGLRTTYGTNMMIAWAKMEGKPVLMQETGISADWVSQAKRAKYLQLEYFSCWADGAAGFVWWCSHNIDTTFRVKPSIDGREFVRNGKFDPLEYQMGLLDAKNNKLPVANAFKQCIDFSAKLGLDWKDKLPVCYIVVPEVISLNDYFRQIINSYVLAKQNHVEVRFLYENKEVPADVAFVIIPGFSIKDENKEHINKYLAIGGTVYQSYSNNFAPNININQKLINSIDSPVELLVAKHTGDLNLLEKFPLSGHLKMAQMSWSKDYETLLKVCPDCNTHSINEKGEGVFFRTKIGKGNFYYTRLNLEESLCDTYNPWKTDESYRIYSVLKPEMDIDIDSRFVEFYHKSNAKEEMIILLNHTYENQQTNIISKQQILLKERQNGKVIGKGTEFNFSLKPAEVMFLMVERK
jgi:hypothetical protein